MNLQERKELLIRLGNYMLSEDDQWQETKQKAVAENSWFIPAFVELAIKNIADTLLNPRPLQKLIDQYGIPAENQNPKKIGIVMAGNIPLVGFHDMLCTFLTGNFAYIKLSSKDAVLIPHLANKLYQWNADANYFISISEMLKDCDAYIATGSNNSSRYFEYYFRNHPCIIRKNRTSVAVLSGQETQQELEALADDVYQFFGLGCRNVTKLYVPEQYNFVPLLNAFKKYNHLSNHNKYKNNYDYNLAMHILNNTSYMSNESLLLIEDSSFFSRISQLHYEYYSTEEEVRKTLRNNENIQCIISRQDVQLGEAQCPQANDFADGIDTLKFLMQLNASKENGYVNELRRP